MNSTFVFTNGSESIEHSSLDLDSDVAGRLTALGPLTITQKFSDGTSRLILDAGKVPSAGEVAPATPIKVAPVSSVTVQSAEVMPAKADTIPSAPVGTCDACLTFGSDLADCTCDGSKVPSTVDPTASSVAESIQARNAAPAIVDRSTFAAQVMADPSVVAAVTAQHAGLAASGFTIPRTWFPVGTLLAESGVRNFQDAKNAWEQSPTLEVGTAQIEHAVQDEMRRDIVVRVGDLKMIDDGTISRTGGSIAFTDAALKKFSAAIGMPSAGTYLAACEPDLRALNVNRWITQNRDKDILFRTRKSITNGPREVFAIVSPGYAKCDMDRIAGIIREACKGLGDARVHAVYDADGGRGSFDVEFMTPIQPNKAVVGEVWRATVRVRGNDTGGGSISGGSGVSMAICLNFTYASANGHSFSLRHIGADEKIVSRLREHLAKSIAQVKPLLVQWNKATETDIVAQARLAARASGDMLPDAVIPARLWLLAGVVERELVPVVGRKSEAVKRLMHWHEHDVSSAVSSFPTSRASIVNAFTRYAHEETSDPWETDTIQKAASKLLFSDRPLPVYNPDLISGFSK